MAVFPSKSKWIWELLRRNPDYRRDFAILQTVREEFLRAAKAVEVAGVEEHEPILAKLVVTDAALIGRATQQNDFVAIGNWKNKLPTGLGDLLQELVQFHREVTFALLDPLCQVISPDLDFAEQSLSLVRATHPWVIEGYPHHYIERLVDTRRPFKQITAETNEAVKQARRASGLRTKGTRPGRNRGSEDQIWGQRLRLFDAHPKAGAAQAGWVFAQVQLEFPELARKASTLKGAERNTLLKDAGALIRKQLGVVKGAVDACYEPPHAFVYGIGIKGDERPVRAELRHLIANVIGRKNR